MEYLALIILLISIELIYFKIANKFNIVDKPNCRSSHQQVTIRGGGILFPIALIITYLLGYVSWQIAVAVTIVGIVSFIDDIKPMSQLPRFTSHIVAVALLFHDLNMLQGAIWLLPIVFILMIGWVNAFNFMDGINGITVLYSLIAIVTFSFLPVNEPILPLLLIMGISCCVFGYFNLRKRAKTFAGDVGSISMALFLGYVMIKTIIETNQLGFLLFFAVYGIDAVITIIYRIIKKENILEPHRSHLYQYLCNEKGFSHVSVAAGYAGVQAALNAILIYIHAQGYLNLMMIFLLLLVLTTIYLVIRMSIVKQPILKKL